MVLLCGLLTSCSTTQSNPKLDVTIPKAAIEGATKTALHKPNVTFLRKWAMPTRLKSRMKVDGQEIVRLKNKQYARVYIEPGQHELKVSYAPISLQPGTSEDVLIEAGKNYIFELLSNTSVGSTYGYGHASTGVYLKERSSEYFNLSELKCCENVSN